MNLVEAKNIIEEVSKREGVTEITIGELAELQKAVSILQEESEVWKSMVVNDPRWDKISEITDAIQESEEAKRVEEYTEFVAKGKVSFDVYSDLYKKNQKEKFEQTGEKQYPGGNIQVRRKLVVWDDLQLATWLADNHLYEYLQVDKKKIGQDFTESFFVRNDLENFNIAGYEDQIIATLSKDLSSQLLEDAE